ncbi:hexose transporter [Mycena olivaceomarginata]|nr:hexose transporter [Mycena olivaceomarginata]
MAGEPVAIASGTNAYARLMDPNRKWYNNRRLIALNTWIVLLLITSSTNGYDGSMMNGLQSLTQWEGYFDHPTKGKLGLLNAIQNIGALAGYPFAPYMADGIGRKPTIFFGALIMVIGTAVRTASTNAAPMLVTELSYPKYRAALTSAYNSLCAAWATFGTFKINTTWAWRIPSLLQVIPSVLQVISILFAPESPQALETLAYYHADSNEDDPLVKYEFEEIKAAIELDRAIAANVGWKFLFSTPGNRKRVRIIVAIAVFSQWSANGLVSYYLNKVLTSIGVTDPIIQLLISGVLQIWNLIWALAASSMVERFGRRNLFMTSVSAGHAVIAFIFLYSAAYALAFTPLVVLYTLEILPFNIRAKGFNISNLTISLAIIFNQYINPIALDAIGWKCYIVYCVWLVFESIFLYFCAQRNRTLEETVAIFDGTGATDPNTTSAATSAITETQSAISRGANRRRQSELSENS